MKQFLIKYIGANYRTTLTGVGMALTGTLTGLAALPSQIEDLGTIVPPAWKAKIVLVAGIATLILKFLDAVFTKSNNVSGNGSSAITVSTSQGEAVTVIPAPEERPKVQVMEPPKP